MNEYLQFKGKIQQRVEMLEGAVRELELSGLAKRGVLSRWSESLDQVKTSLQDSLVRIAVVGAVKSGKSTLINTLLGRDLLMRGAGIITAFITRIQTNGRVGGWVELKPWAQIQKELNASLRMFPLYQEEMSESDALDIRCAEDRERLKAFLDRAQIEWQQNLGRLDPHFILLKGYLEGYFQLRDEMDEDIRRLVLDEDSIGRHRHYVGREGQAVYVRDMELHYPVPWLGQRVEIADCQGSDSPNPLHFELLQRYLLKSQFILYVISSRTGLREADFKLLDFIKTLRMFPQTFFILNVDLDAHPHVEDLNALVNRVRSELSWVVPRPALFAFSGLYHLIDQLHEELPEREGRRLEFWKEDAALARCTEGDFAAFREEMRRRIVSQRTRILLGSGLSRLSMVAAGILDTARAQKRFIDENLGSLKEFTGQLKTKQKALQGTLRTLENAIAGLQDSVKQELDQAADGYFHLKEGLLVGETLDMVEHYPISEKYYRELTDYRQFLHKLYHFYREFRQSISRYLVEKVNVRVIEFAKEQEAFLHDRLSESSQSFWALFGSALEDYRREMAQFQIDLRAPGDLRHCQWPSMEMIIPPTFSPFMDQEALGPGVLLMKFGLGCFTRFLTGIKSRMGKQRDLLQWRPQESETIQEAVSLVKSETKSELLHAFQEYHKSFKFRYLHRLLDEMTRFLLEEFRLRAEMTELDFVGILKQSEVEGKGRAAMRDLLIRTVELTEGMAAELDELRCLVQLEWLSSGGEASPKAREPSEPVPIS